MGDEQKKPLGKSATFRGGMTSAYAYETPALPPELRRPRRQQTGHLQAYPGGSSARGQRKGPLVLDAPGPPAGREAGAIFGRPAATRTGCPGHHPRTDRPGVRSLSMSVAPTDRWTHEPDADEVDRREHGREHVC